jgi:hypothetical protein
VSESAVRAKRGWVWFGTQPCSPKRPPEPLLAAFTRKRAHWLEDEKEGILW